MKIFKNIFCVIVATVIITSCNHIENTSINAELTSINKNVKEIHSGILGGYLTKDEYPYRK